MARVCLNMIVKDEAAIIERCLAAVAPHIDCWVILDTGSSDATPAIIESFFAERGIPGQLVHGRFENFEQARNDALDAARKADLDFDWLLLADADMELRVDDPSWRKRLVGPACVLLQRSGSFAYRNVRLLRREHPARYVGVTHEYVDLGAPPAALNGLWFIDHAEGSSRTVKYARDIALLTKAVETEPDNARYVFYLAQSYRDAGETERAIGFYRQRAAMGGWAEEVWYALFQIGVLSERLEAGDAAVVPAYLAAWQFRPSRAEPLVALAAYHRKTDGRHYLADLFARRAMEISPTSDALFVDESAYGWAVLDESAVAAYWVGDHGRSAKLCQQLLGRSDIPAEHRDRIAANLGHARAALPGPRRPQGSRRRS
ncbi:MAG TPA: glycosyltransferase [Sporichthyaceae bacterium]|jgi:glycosyltransferase involved in cell wall biosynthesis|nr:glycosyltransferase [Sporichthyaceae bacterium]